MIQLSNSTEQTIQPNQSLVFDRVLVRSSCGECFRNNTSSVKMRANGVYEALFNANVGGTAAGEVELTLELTADTALPETRMVSTVAAEGDLNNVSCQTLVRNCCCDYDRISVTNTGTTPIVVAANSSFIVRKVS